MPQSIKFVSPGCGWATHVSFEGGKLCSSLKLSHSYLTPGTWGALLAPCSSSCPLEPWGPAWGTPGVPRAPLASGRWGRRCVLWKPASEGALHVPHASPHHFCRPVPWVFPPAPVLPVHLLCPLKCGPMAGPIAPYVALPTLDLVSHNCGPGSLQAAVFLAEYRPSSHKIGSDITSRVEPMSKPIPVLHSREPPQTSCPASCL